jgi:hypothetical protein
VQFVLEIFEIFCRDTLYMYLEGKLFIYSNAIFSPGVMPQKQNPCELRAARATKKLFVFKLF